MEAKKQGHPTHQIIQKESEADVNQLDDQNESVKGQEYESNKQMVSELSSDQLHSKNKEIIQAIESHNRVGKLLDELKKKAQTIKETEQEERVLSQKNENIVESVHHQIN